MNQRDDFSQDTIRKLGERVGLRCSKCGAPTKGPHTSGDKAANIGKACHIHAAAPGGPRYDANQTEEERRSIENGIWLCSNCGTLIDNDEARYPAATLHAWKKDAEQAASVRVGRPEALFVGGDATGGAAPPLGRGGRGGSAKVVGTGVAIGGAAGGGGPPWAAKGGDGGDAEVGGDGFALGGEGGQAGQADGSGGRGGRSPLDVLGISLHDLLKPFAASVNAAGDDSTRFTPPHEEQCVSAYREVLTALAVLRAAGEQLARDHDWNQAQYHEMYEPTNEAIRKAFDAIEHRRLDLAVSFAEAAKSVVEFWDSLSSIFWEGLYLADVSPSLDERMAAMLNAIPQKYRLRVAPGYFDENDSGR